MSTMIGSRSDIYRELDNIIGRASSVVFGSGTLAEIPIAELIGFFGLNISVCNRSIADMSIENAREHLDECVFRLNPSKVFLYFGDECTKPGFKRDEFMSNYEALIDLIAERCDCSIYILSVMADSEAAHELNVCLSSLAQDSGCNYIDLSDCRAGEHATLRLFKRLSNYMRENKLSFSEAMSLASV